MRCLKLVIPLLVLVFGLGAPASAQITRPQELNRQLHRAETAWRSGASMLEAKTRVDQVLEQLPNDVEALKLRAEVLLGMGRAEEALVDAQQAVRLAPEDGKAHLLVCEAARRTGDLKLAAQALDAAAELVSEDPELHVRLSWDAVLLEQLDKAEAFARIATASDPQGAAGYYQLARVFVLKDQPNDAAMILEGGLRDAFLDPTVIQADTVLVRLVDHPSLRPFLNR